MNTDVRTRFAPSPTGFLHVGGIRTALFAWLVARQNDGKFILRLEDTDKKREVAGSEKHLIKSLRILGLDYDEGPDIGGSFGPYRQSDRLEIYKVWAQKLITSGRAYADPYTPEQVQTFREQAQQAKQPFLYRNHRPKSFTDWDGNTPLRFLSEPKSYNWKDCVMGQLSTGPEVIDDFVLIKSDGYPTYNFAHIVDDAEMQISHVFRAQEFLASTPNYLNLYEALNIQRPILATLPHILADSGKKKLSKRDGAKDVLDYIKDGYLPEALVNFIASMGWNDGTEQEIFTVEELIKKFDLKRVQHSGARFDQTRLEWMNGCFIRALELKDLYNRVATFWPHEASSYGDDYKIQVLGLLQERLKFFSELPQLTNFFFKDLPIDPKLIHDNKHLKKYNGKQLHNLLDTSLVSLKLSDFTPEDLTIRLNDLLEATSEKPSVLFSLIRIATTQSPNSPALAETMAVLGNEVCLRRIEEQLSVLL